MEIMYGDVREEIKKIKSNSINCMNLMQIKL